jgi:hypothetical protein
MPRPDTALPYEPHTAWDALPSGDEVGVVSGGVDRGSLDPQTRRLLEAPIVLTLLRLGAPNVLIMLAQAGVGLIETFFVGKLGTDALAGMALVFPAVMLMQTISAGAFGGAIASAIARALGSAVRAATATRAAQGALDIPGLQRHKGAQSLIK